MRIQIDIKNDPKKDDVLIYNGKEYENISKGKLLIEVNKQIEDLQNQIKELKEENENFKKAVNGKLKEHHEVLQVLTK